MDEGLLCRQCIQLRSVMTSHALALGFDGIGTTELVKTRNCTVISLLLALQAVYVCVCVCVSALEPIKNP